jgi:hypothetical protein
MAEHDNALRAIKRANAAIAALVAAAEEVDAACNDFTQPGGSDSSAGTSDGTKPVDKAFAAYGPTGTVEPNTFEVQASEHASGQAYMATHAAAILGCAIYFKMMGTK